MSDTNIQQQNNQDSAYLFKKTERLASALYLLTSFITDREPIKWQIRETGLKLLSQSLSLNQGDVSALGNIPLINLILSFLEVAHLGGLISTMNHDILKYEFDALKTVIDQAEKERLKGAVYSKDFFMVSGQGNALALEGIQSVTNSIGQNNLSDRLSVKNGELKQKDKSNRQDIIIGLLKKNPELGIKDFVMAIKDCSEKTVQRELATLVSKGQVKKEGEKRWSRYMLK